MPLPEVCLVKVFFSCGIPSAAGFEGCSMVPSIYPLETLHNSLSLKQVDDFLNRVCESSSEAHAKTMKGENQPPLCLWCTTAFKYEVKTLAVCLCSFVQPVWLSESVISLQSSAPSVLFRLWDIPAPAKSESVAWVWNRTSYLYMNTTVRFKEVVRVTSNQIISTSACFNLIGCWDFVFQMAVSPPVPCPALAPPPLSQRAPPLTSPSMTKWKSVRNSGLENVGRMCLSSTHAHKWAADLCVYQSVHEFCGQWENLLLLLFSLSSGTKQALHRNLPTILFCRGAVGDLVEQLLSFFTDSAAH